MKKVLLAAALTAFLAPSADAAPIKIDWTGTAYEDTNLADNPTGDGFFSNTNWFNLMLASYRSNTVITDSDGSGTLNAGDTIVTNGGLAIYSSLLQGISLNTITGTDPNSIISGSSISSVLPSDYGVTQDWAITFSVENLLGYYDGEFLQYTSGNVVFKLYDAVSNTVQDLFNVAITGSDYSAGNAQFNGYVDSVQLDVFKVLAPSGEQSFADYNAANDVKLAFQLDQNLRNGESGTALENIVNGLWGNTGTAGVANLGISDNHVGQVAINVPEPASLAVFGLGLLGLAGFSRRKA